MLVMDVPMSPSHVVTFQSHVSQPTLLFLALLVTWKEEEDGDLDFAWH